MLRAKSKRLTDFVHLIFDALSKYVCISARWCVYSTKHKSCSCFSSTIVSQQTSDLILIELN